MFKDTKEGQNNFYLPCGHSFLEHQMMLEAYSSAAIEGAVSSKTICELIDMSKNA